ncbi:hypothetical protein C8R45DRAFT_1185028, partial [Mycena sanguinolenta]
IESSCQARNHITPRVSCLVFSAWASLQFVAALVPLMISFETVVRLETLTTRQRHILNSEPQSKRLNGGLCQLKSGLFLEIYILHVFSDGLYVWLLRPRTSSRRLTITVSNYAVVHRSAHATIHAPHASRPRVFAVAPLSRLVFISSTLLPSTGSVAVYSWPFSDASSHAALDTAQIHQRRAVMVKISSFTVFLASLLSGLIIGGGMIVVLRNPLLYHILRLERNTK